jgi:hypothetical protein
MAVGIHRVSTMSTDPSLFSRFRAALATLRPETLDDLRDLYDPDLEFRDPIQTLHGVDAFIAMNRRLFARFRELEFDVTSGTGSDTDLFLVWTMRAAPKFGPRLVVDGATHARVGGGRVTYQHDYWDLGELVARAVPGGQGALRLLLKPFA